MARGDRLNLALRTRILTSGQEITVHYPPVKTPATGTAPGPAPLNPLTGAPPTQQMVVTSSSTPSQPPKTMPCLWHDAFYTVKTRAASALDGGKRAFERLGWVEGAEAMARVLLEDILLDPTNSASATLFSQIDHVEFRGRRYHVMGEDRISSGFQEPITAYVWLIGAQGQ